MKKILLLCLLCMSFFGFSQEINREKISGLIIVEGNDVEGITVFNTTSEAGTVTNENGEFSLDVALNDLIKIRALEYKDLDVVINETMLESKELRVFLIEEIVQLDKVVITKKNLTGNLATDIANVKTFYPKMDAIYFGMKDKDTYALSDDTRRQMTNIAQPLEGQSMVNGLNVVNIVDQLLIPLFRSEVKDKKAAGVPEVPVESIKYYLGSNFLIDNFDIPAYRVEEFIRYVEDDAFNFDLLNYGNEMEFLQLLSRKSTTFLSGKETD